MSADGHLLDLQRLQERVDELERQLCWVANAVDDWPEHPWIPGGRFNDDDELTLIITEHRTRPEHHPGERPPALDAIRRVGWEDDE